MSRINFIFHQPKSNLRKENLEQNPYRNGFRDTFLVTGEVTFSPVMSLFILTS